MEIVVKNLLMNSELNYHLSKIEIIKKKGK